MCPLSKRPSIVDNIIMQCCKDLIGQKFRYIASYKKRTNISDKMLKVKIPIVYFITAWRPLIWKLTRILKIWAIKSQCEFLDNFLGFIHLFCSGWN